jgi:hypothetical protein
MCIRKKQSIKALNLRTSNITGFCYDEVVAEKATVRTGMGREGEGKGVNG